MARLVGCEESAPGTVCKPVVNYLSAFGRIPDFVVINRRCEDECIDDWRMEHQLFQPSHRAEPEQLAHAGCGVIARVESPVFLIDVNVADDFDLAYTACAQS